MQRVAKAYKARGDEVMKWKSPSGFTVSHPRLRMVRDPDALPLRYRVRGRDRKSTIATKWVPDRKSYAVGFAPNFVHSIDASHLTHAVTEARYRGVHSFAVVHDSFGCHAGRMQVLRDQLRETFAPAVLKARETLNQLAAAVGVKLPPLGKLDLERVKESDGLFT